MTHKLELYKCDICTNIIEIVEEGAGILECCNEEMKQLKEFMPEANDPHFAHLKNIDELTKKISFNHPMSSEHFIEFIEVISNDKKYIKRKYLKQNEPCELIFKCDCKEGFYIRIYCNIHGVQKTMI